MSGERVYLIHFNPLEKKGWLVQMPEELQVESIKDYGKYRIGSLLSLGSIEGKGSELMRLSASREFGLFILGVLESAEVSDLSTWRASHWWPLLSHSGVQPADSFRLAWQLGQASWTMVNLADIGVILEATEIDGTKIYELQQLAWDDYYQRKIQVQMPEFSRISIAVENTTNKSGLATQWGRLLKNEGYDLVNVNDGGSTLPQSELVYSSVEIANSLGFQTLKRRMPHLRVRNGDTSQMRSQVLLRLALDEGLPEGWR